MTWNYDTFYVRLLIGLFIASVRHLSRASIILTSSVENIRGIENKVKGLDKRKLLRSTLFTRAQSIATLSILGKATFTVNMPQF